MNEVMTNSIDAQSIVQTGPDSGIDGIRYATLSAQGDRSYNEDYLGAMVRGQEGIFIVADGLGGHGHGDVASHTVVDAMLSLWQQEETQQESELDTKQFPSIDALLNEFEVDASSWLDRGLCFAQSKLCQLKEEEEFGDMMTTVVSLHCTKEHLRWAHIGDSRLYYFKDGALVTQTLDHSVPQVLVQTGEITTEEIRKHPDRNRLLRAMGKEWDYSVGYKLSEEIPREGAQAFLLCTDGFWEYVLESEMQEQLASATTPEEWLLSMERIVCERGADDHMDNYSAVAVWIEN